MKRSPKEGKISPPILNGPILQQDPGRAPAKKTGHRVGAALLAALILVCALRADRLVVHGCTALYRAGVIRQLNTETLRAWGAGRDQEEYRRMLFRLGWIQGRSTGELIREFGPPEGTADRTLIWNVGWNIIDPEVLMVQLDTSGTVAEKALICEGMVGTEQCAINRREEG